MNTVFCAAVFLALSLPGCASRGSANIPPVNRAATPHAAAYFPGAATSMPLSLGSAFPKALDVNVTYNVAPSHPLAHVRSFEYLIGDQTEGGKIARLAAGRADMVVIDVPSSMPGYESYNSAADVARLKNSNGGAGRRKIVLAYLDIGEAEEHRTYWKPGWKWSDDPSQRTTPAWIVAKDPDGWDGNYPVAYWTAAWKNIIYDAAGSAIDRIVAAGYDGVYLDWVEAHSFDPVIAQARAAGIDPDQAIIDFIAALKAKARRVSPNFLVVAQNATQLRVYPRYMSLLDGQGQEQVFFDGPATTGPATDPTQGDCQLPLHHGDRPPSSNPAYCTGLTTLGGSSEDYIRALAQYLQAGIPVFTIDYALERQHAAYTYAQDAWFHFVGLVTMRTLNDLTTTPAPVVVASGAQGTSSGWQITVYYTAVLQYYSGPTRDVFGCSDLECSRKNVYLGTYPASFIDAVKTEGTGKLAQGAFLNWSGDTGYWRDNSSRDAQGNALVPYRSAAADPSIAFGTAFRVVSCGADTATGTPTEAAVCSTYQAPQWLVVDRFTAGAVGKHVDLYIGEQDSLDFTSGPKFIDASNSAVQF